MYIDYIRVYQRSDVDAKDGVGCSPSHHPTEDYINACVQFLFKFILDSSLSFVSRHANAYNNPNLTTWDQAGYTFPRNSLYDGC